MSAENPNQSMTLTLGREDIVRLADRIEAAQTGAQAIPKLTDDYPGMTLADGYAVQLELRRRWLRSWCCRRRSRSFRTHRYRGRYNHPARHRT